MSQNQEIIEAKLCAFIDGELDPEGIAEIEKHLASNPQHRRLLESLKATRDLIRWLPRENAPPELAETLNGQLERSVLLDYAPERAMRISRWPRVFAAAAIVLLTAGLGAAVYFALPKHKAPVPYVLGRQMESKSPVPHPPLVSTTVPESGESGLGERIADRGERSAVRGKAAAAKNGDLGREEPLDRLLKEVKENPDRLLALAAAPGQTAATFELPTTESAAPEALVMVVASSDPGSTQSELTDYFRSNGIAWKAAAEPVPTELLSQRIGGRGLQHSSLAVQSEDQKTEREQSPTTSRGTLVSKVAGPRDVEAAGQVPPLTPGGAATTAESNAPSADKRKPAEDGQTQSFAANSRIDGLYVARMSRRQVETLRQAQRAELLNDSEQRQQEVVPEAPARNALMRRSEGRLRSAYPAAAPTTVATTLPQQPQPEPPVFRAPADVTAATPAGEAGGLAETHAAANDATTRPAAERQTNESAPTTLPVADQQSATQPAEDQPVNVVILVQQTAAATQPTTAPATTQP